MKIISISLMIVLALASYAMAGDKDLDTSEQRISYGLGHNIGSSVIEQYKEVDTDALFEGIRDAMAGKEPRVSEEQVKKDIEEYARKRTAEATEAGEEFLAKNKKKKGVKTLPSGLQYRVEKAGKGKSPTATEEVVVHYKGTLLDGTVFDSSYKRGKPTTFPVNGVIKGMGEALQLMKEGAKWTLYIPPYLAYGERGAGGAIGPGETLIFELEMIEVK